MDTPHITWSRETVRWFAVVLVGALVGFIGGLFGKGGSAIATPLLAAVGVPPIVALASPLPATVPATVVAYLRYRRLGISETDVIRWSIAVGVPATIVGALLTRWLDGALLVQVTDVLLVGTGIRVLARPDDAEVVRTVSRRRLRVVAVAVVVGLVSGLLANSGGFLLVPLYLAAIRLPIKSALATSLAVSSALALPGTAVHLLLGHIDWRVTAVFAAASIPLSSIGASTAVRMDSRALQRCYGAGLLTLGAAFLVLR